MDFSGTIRTALGLPQKGHDVENLDIGDAHYSDGFKLQRKTPGRIRDCIESTKNGSQNTCRDACSFRRACCTWCRHGKSIIARKFVTSSNPDGVGETERFSSPESENIPNFFGRVTEFTTRHTGTQTIVADTDCIIFKGICKIITALGHGTNEDADALLGVQRLDVILNTDYRRLETERHLPTVGR